MNTTHSAMDRKIEKKAAWLKPLLAGGAVLVLFLWYLFSPGLASTFTLDGERIRIAEVSAGVFEDYIPLRASVEPKKTVYLDAVEGGRVEEVFVEEGAMVVSGQDLLRLSNTSLQLDVIAREAEVSEQLNNLRNTQLAIEQNRLKLKGELIEINYQIVKLTRLVERFDRLSQNEFLSRNEYENAQDELDYWKQKKQVTQESQAQDEKIRTVQIAQLKTSAKQLNENLVLARANLDNLTVKASRAGHLTSFNAEIGESKARGERLGQIDDVDQFKAVAMVSEFYINRVRGGQMAQLEIDGAEYLLRVNKVYPEVANSQFEIDLEFLGTAPAEIRRGQTLQLRLVLGDVDEQAVLIANGPFYNDTGGAWVYVLNRQGDSAEKRNTELGRRNPRYIEVLGGLLPGDKIIISSYDSFIDIDRLLIEQ